MLKLLKVIVLFSVMAGFTGVVYADPPDLNDWPEVIEIDGIIYSRIIIDDEVYYTYDGVVYIYDAESGEVLAAEVSFPGS